MRRPPSWLGIAFRRRDAITTFCFHLLYSSPIPSASVCELCTTHSHAIASAADSLLPPLLQSSHRCLSRRRRPFLKPLPSPFQPATTISAYSLHSIPITPPVVPVYRDRCRYLPMSTGMARQQQRRLAKAAHGCRASSGRGGHARASHGMLGAARSRAKRRYRWRPV